MKLRYILTIFALGGLISSCSNFLDLYPKDSPAAEEFYSNETELELAINGAYRGLYWMSNDNVPYHMYLEGAADHAFVRSGANMDVVRTGEATQSTSIFSGVWSKFYSSIALCNNVLTGMVKAKDNVPADFYNRIEAEAKTIRAYNYYWLTVLYGDVPYLDGGLAWNAPSPGVSPKSEIISKLYADLDWAKDWLPATLGPAEQGRMTSGAAMGIKARIALYNGDYETAADAAWEVMDSGVYSIFDSYKDLFLYENRDSAESIMTMRFLDNVATSQVPRYLGMRLTQGYCMIVPTQVLVDYYQCTNGKYISDTGSGWDPATPYDNRDPRLRYTVLVPGTWHCGYLFDPDPAKTKTKMMKDGAIVDVANADATHAYRSFTGLLFRKYYDEADIPDRNTRSQLKFMIMRYAEILLTYAEAKIEADDIDQSVIDAINEVRQRADVNMPAADISMTTAELRELVRYERSVELALEGFRLLDIRRWGVAEDVLSGTVLGRRKKANWYDQVTPMVYPSGQVVYPDEGIFEPQGVCTFNPATQLIWPIPQDAIDRNPNLQDQQQEYEDDGEDNG